MTDTTKQMYATPGDTGVAPQPDNMRSPSITNFDREQVPEDEKPGYTAPTGKRITNVDREQVPDDER